MQHINWQLVQTHAMKPCRTLLRCHYRVSLSVFGSIELGLTRYICSEASSSGDRGRTTILGSLADLGDQYLFLFVELLLSVCLPTLVTLVTSLQRYVRTVHAEKPSSENRGLKRGYLPWPLFSMLFLLYR